MTSRSIGFRRQLMAVSILVSLAPLFFITTVLYYYYDIVYRDKIVAYLETLVEHHAAAVDIYLSEKLSNIRLQTMTHSLEDLADPGFMAQRLKDLQTAYSGAFNDLGLVDDQGVQLAYAGPFMLQSANYADTDWFRESIENETFISDVFLGIRRTPHFIVTSRTVHKGRPWLLRATIDFADFNAVVRNISIGRTGSAFIINTRGEFQTDRRVETAMDSGIISDIASQEYEHNRAVFMERRSDIHDKTYFLVSVPLKGGDWILVLQQERGDALVHLYRARTIMFATLVVGTVGIVLTVAFVTRRLGNKIDRAEAKQQVMQRQMVEAGKLVAIGELAAGVAHEINNPVAIMVENAGWVQDLVDGGECTEDGDVDEIRHSLHEIFIQGQRCKEITHKLLSFARRTDSRIHHVNVNEMVEELAGFAEQKVRYNHVRIVRELDETLPMLMASPTDLQQVVLNLLNNAIDAIDKEDGLIVLRTYTSEDGGTMFIEVEDNGMGIAPANASRIFEPFYTTKPVGKGTGLGLSICYGIINKMGGEIAVESERGEGALFKVSIPIVERTDPEEEGDRAMEESA